MAKRVQLIRHTSGTANTFVGLEGEVTVDLTNDQLRVHDGVTPGGIAQARQDLSTTQAATSSNDGKMTAALVTLLQALDALTIVHGTRINTIEANIIPAGTVMLFMQAAAPVGWTQVNTHSNKALRIVAGAGAGSGGSVAFATIFGAGKATGSTTLTTNQIPAHTHGFSATTSSNGSHAHAAPGGVPFVGANGSGSDAGNFAVGVNNDYFNQTAAAGDHTHSVSGTTAVNSTAGSGHTHTLSLDLQYVDIIACSKDAY